MPINNTNVEEEPPLPAIFGHCQTVYDLMRQQAEVREVEGEGRIVVWEGFLTRLLGQELNLPTPYYTSVRTNLVRMGCVKQLQRGGGNSPSQWELITRPTAPLFREKAPKRNQRDLEMENLRGQITDLRDRQGKLEKMFGKLVDFVNGNAEALPPSTHNPATGEALTSTDHTHEVLPSRTGIGAETDETEVAV